MAKQDPPDTTRDARLGARVSAAHWNLLQQAVALSGRTLKEFVVASAQDAARRVIAEHESIRLSREEQLAFVKAPLNPPQPKSRIERAAKAYRQSAGRTGSPNAALSAASRHPAGTAGRRSIDQRPRPR